METGSKDKIAAKFNFFLSGIILIPVRLHSAKLLLNLANLAQEEYAAQSTQERGTVEAAKEYAKDFYNSNHALDGMPKVLLMMPIG